MSINPNNPVHRQRFGRAFDHSFTHLDRFANMRDNTVKAYLGATPGGEDWDTASRSKSYERNLPKGNLLQLAGLSLQVSLAYGEPEFLCVNRVPEHAGLCEKLGPALNRMSKLLNLGEVARAVAADSFFGYGIFKVGVGRMPLSAQAATGLSVGPCVWRVGQRNFIYDIEADSWDNCAYQSDLYPMALNDAIEMYPEHADRIQAMTNSDRMDAQHVMPRPSNSHSAEEKVWFADVYFPSTQVIATWPVRNHSFAGSFEQAPVAVREYEGHWSGIYQVVSHLYSPDELVPIAQAESVKFFHFLLGDLIDITSEQARLAKVHPLYQAGSEKDMRRIWEATDRHPVSVVDPTRFGQLEIPGPTQSQTGYMAAVMQMATKFTPTLDEPERAPTATQGVLDRETTNATIAEARRKFQRALQLVGYKLGHLLLNNNDLVLPSYKKLNPGSNVQVDVSWLPMGLEPRVAKIDDLDVAIEPYSTILRTPKERMAQLNAAIAQVIAVMQAQAGGAPISSEKYLEIAARYEGTPELQDLFEEADPMHQAKAQASHQSPPRPGVGQYTRTNVSEKTEAGALEANLAQMGDEGGGSEPRFE